MVYLVKCNKCGKTMKTTNKWIEATVGGICWNCRKKKLRKKGIY